MPGVMIKKEGVGINGISELILLAGVVYHWFHMQPGIFMCSSIIGVTDCFYSLSLDSLRKTHIIRTIIDGGMLRYIAKLSVVLTSIIQQ